MRNKSYWNEVRVNSNEIIPRRELWQQLQEPAHLWVPVIILEIFIQQTVTQSLHPSAKRWQADATALHRAAKKLRNFNYEDDTTDSANIYGSVNAFIQVYNNTLSSGNKTDDASLNRYSRYLKSLSKEHSSELSRIGITVNSDGSLSANDNLLKSAKVSKVKTLFADDAEYITKVSRYSKKMAEKADSVVLSETLGSNIDLTL